MPSAQQGTTLTIPRADIEDEASWRRTLSWLSFQIEKSIRAYFTVQYLVLLTRPKKKAADDIIIIIMIHSLVVCTVITGTGTRLPGTGTWYQRASVHCSRTVLYERVLVRCTRSERQFAPPPSVSLSNIVAFLAGKFCAVDERMRINKSTVSHYSIEVEWIRSWSIHRAGSRVCVVAILRKLRLGCPPWFVPGKPFWHWCWQALSHNFISQAI